MPGGPGWGGGVLQISSDGVVRRIFWGLKFTVLGVFWIYKYWGSLILVRILLGAKKNGKIHGKKRLLPYLMLSESLLQIVLYRPFKRYHCSSLLSPLGICKAAKIIQHGIFLGGG